MNESLETIVKRLAESNHNESAIVGECARDLMDSREKEETDDELAQRIDDSMDELIAAAKIVKAWAKKGVSS